MFSSHSADNDVDAIWHAIPTIIAQTIARCAILYAFAFLVPRVASPRTITAGMNLWHFLVKRTRNTSKVTLSTLFTRIEQLWRLYSSVEFVGLCIARSSSAPETCTYSQGEFSAIARTHQTCDLVPVKARDLPYCSVRQPCLYSYPALFEHALHTGLNRSC